MKMLLRMKVSTMSPSFLIRYKSSIDSTCQFVRKSLRPTWPYLMTMNCQSEISEYPGLWEKPLSVSNTSIIKIISLIAIKEIISFSKLMAIKSLSEYLVPLNLTISNGST